MRNTIERYLTRAWAEIDLSVIRQNYKLASEYAAKYGAEIMAIMKANAYGHGAKQVAAELKNYCGARYFAVATFDEALELIEAGIASELNNASSILVLSEVHPSLYDELCDYSNIYTSIFRRESAIALSKAAQKAGKKMKYYLVLDTGMSRIGFECSTPEKKRESLEAVEEIIKLPSIECVGIFSHYACADERDKTSALKQKAIFDDFVLELNKRGINPQIKSMCNSAALTEPEFTEKYNLAREGIGLYGLSPSDEVINRLGVVPAMSLKARVTFVKTLGAGIGISYGHTYVTERETRVATIPVGYADGYPRLLSGKAGVLIDGKYAPILGRVCMDQMMVDVTDIPSANIDSVATLIGSDERIRADRLAAKIGTIGYELICAVSPRIPRIYIGGISN
jgi:alanine racemase